MLDIDLKLTRETLTNTFHIFVKIMGQNFVKINKIFQETFTFTRPCINEFIR